MNYRNKKCRRYIPLLQGEYQPYPDASFSFHFPGIPVNQQLAVFYIILLGRTRANNVTSSGYASRSSSSIKMGTRRNITSLSPGGGGGGGTPVCGLYGDVPPDKVWFFTSLRVCTNWVGIFVKQGCTIVVV